MNSAKLIEFRQAAYKYLGKAKDAILLSRNINSLAELSLSPVFRRQWPSVYEALQDSRPQRTNLMKLYTKQIPTQGRPLIAGDHTPNSRQSN